MHKFQFINYFVRIIVLIFVMHLILGCAGERKYNSVEFRENLVKSFLENLEKKNSSYIYYQILDKHFYYYILFEFNNSYYLNIYRETYIGEKQGTFLNELRLSDFDDSKFEYLSNTIIKTFQLENIKYDTLGYDVDNQIAIFNDNSKKKFFPKKNKGNYYLIEPFQELDLFLSKYYLKEEIDK